MAEEKQVAERDMTGWSEEEIERGSTFIDRFMAACRDVKAMRDGLKPKPTISIEEMLAQIEREAQEEERLEREAELAKQAKRAARA
ncbi:MAG: hypothetical protein IJ668_02265 [Selenomonadaceae bacterium]|nr:hypothetical protein [Selenomonadaceae bacterium]